MSSNISLSEGSTISKAVVEQLAGTKGWTRFFSVLLWIGAIFLILGGLVMMSVGGIAGMGNMPNGAAGALSGMMSGVVLGIIYIVMSIIYIYPAVKLGKFSSRISDLMNSPVESNLIAALNEQRAFWKYVGIWMIIFLAIYAIGIAVMIVLAGVTAASQGLN